MSMRLYFAVTAGGTVIGGGSLAGRHRRDLDAARARLAAADHTVISTASAAVEYAGRGTGGLVLAIHGIFGGCDLGLLSVGELFPGRRVICPSRSGYLGSSLPPGATPADQAGALAALPGQLSADVIAVSAGTTPALKLALSHSGAGSST